jgi:alanyl-tRNA synthetase
LHQLVPLIAKQFENVFPELMAQKDFVIRVVREEEESFLNTLDKGLKKLNDQLRQEIEKIFKWREDNSINTDTPNPKVILDGKFVFELFDTFGFPFDLTRLILAEKPSSHVDFDVDEAGFEAEMQQQKSRSKSAAAIDTEDWVNVHEHNVTEFVGYDSLEIKSKIVKYRKVKAKGKEGYQIVLSATPFYAESGGQVGDTGQLIINNEQLPITDTKKENNLIIHFADSLPADVRGDLIAKVDRTKRKQIEIHHSATHLLHAALRKVLGTHVAQKGSLVNDEQLRFDFSHFAKVTDEEMAAIEKIVNQKIRENIHVVIKEMTKEEAVKLGAMALFGEKYGDIVRVVIIDPNYSIELCGGTHVGSTGELGFFKIKHESAVAAGVRRIEAVSGQAAETFINDQFNTINAIRESLKNPKEINKAIDTLVLENTELKKKLESVEAKQLTVLKDSLLSEHVPFPFANTQAKFIGKVVEVNSADHLKKLCFDLKNDLGNDYVVVLAANINGKANVAIMLSDSIADEKKLEAPKIIKEYITPIIKGGGGGQKTLATAGGQDASNLQKVIDAVKSLL